MEVDAYLIFSVLLISLLLSGIVVASVYAYSFQKKPANECPSIVPCPDCPEAIPCPGADKFNCIYNLIDFPTTSNFDIFSSVYYDPAPIGGFLTTFNSAVVDGLIGLDLIPTLPANKWTFDGTLLTNIALPTSKFYIFTGLESYFKSLFLGTSPPDSQWKEVVKFSLKDGFIVMTTTNGNIFNLLNYSPQGGSSIAIAAESLDMLQSKIGTFPYSSPFFTSQVWKTL